MAFDSPKLELSEQRPDRRTLVVVASGEIHVSTAPQLAERLATAIGQGSRNVVVDLGDVSFIDSTGLSVLLDAQRQVTRASGRLALVIANPTVLRLFEVTRLDATFAVEPTLEAAMGHLART